MVVRPWCQVYEVVAGGLELLFIDKKVLHAVLGPDECELRAGPLGCSPGSQDHRLIVSECGPEIAPGVDGDLRGRPVLSRVEPVPTELTSSPP